jgi:hypothetical protein
MLIFENTCRFLSLRMFHFVFLTFFFDLFDDLFFILMDFNHGWGATGVTCCSNTHYYYIVITGVNFDVILTTFLWFNKVETLKVIVSCLFFKFCALIIIILDHMENVTFIVLFRGVFLNVCRTMPFHVSDLDIIAFLECLWSENLL